MESGTDFHDYSTRQGRIRSWIHRIPWNYVIGIVGGLFLLFLLLANAVFPPAIQPILMLRKNVTGPIPEAIFTFDGIFILKGTPKKFVTLREIDTILNFTNATTQLRVISLQNVAIDAQSFSNSLMRYSDTIEEIHLNNVTVSGEFNRVFLPNITLFYLKILVPKLEKLEKYQEETMLHSYIFFDQSKEKQWEMKDIGNLDVNILVEVDGYKFIAVNRTRGKGELTLYVPYCDRILQNTKGSYGILSLATCAISKNSIPLNLEYLNFFDVIISDGLMGEILRDMKYIKYLMLDIPNTTLDISEIPKSVVLLSLSTITLTNKNAGTGLPEIHTLSFGFNNISPEVYTNFGENFPNLTHVAAFGLQTANYEFLGRCISLQIDWILVEQFNMNITNSRDKEIDQLLRNIGISENNTSFTLTLPKYGDNFVGSPLTNSQENNMRYTILGWYKFLSLNAYIVADKYIIEM